jgi:biotin synthase
MRDLIDNLEHSHILTAEEFAKVLLCDSDYLFERARCAAQKIYGNEIFIRGLIEFTNYCKNNCYYCGLRAGNAKCQRYRLSKEQILECCKNGYSLGFRTFVLQGGEDVFFTDEILTDIIGEIKTVHPDCAITLSIGERSYESYERLFKAGADRYLLRHETANDEHYKTLHPDTMSSANRKKCLMDLKKIGYQTGCGIMAGSPGQKVEHIIEDLMFIRELQPHMAGIGPFIPHSDTPFKNEKAGDLRLTLNILAILRLMQPNLLIPATTALGTLDSRGRELGILAGANVVMPNLSPVEVRGKYLPYDNKLSTGVEAAEGMAGLRELIKKTGYEIAVSRGDWRAG